MVERPIPTGPLRGTLATDVDMSRYVSWRAGGKAERVYTPADMDDLRAFLTTLPEAEPINFIGLGSNLLVRDGGVRGTVVYLHGVINQIRLDGPQDNARTTFGMVYAEAGVASPKVARFAAKHNLVGAEFLAGIPGTVGGALAMNAGCYGHETWGHVSQVLTVNRRGELKRRSPREFRVGYRHVEPDTARKEWFVAAWFILEHGDGQASRREITRLLKQRIASQPLQLPNAGSVFRNPTGDHAARLIESCGLKGMQIGGAQVSEKHANFIVNRGGASAADIENLIDTVERTVLEKTGIHLQREVRIIGER
ncbi:MAG: UDP-N-acetylmuramate dehydrogenase [Parasulfuritortus sp.]|jgi:UDP-N-acetylmuramate dehydrogenase|nr:UDP-N-acetylmuramate dehydrogenase [Parasulfuritortus sp.]